MDKRERSSNFTYKETDDLISLVEKHKNIIENKKSDATNWKMKDDAWKKIESSFNATSGTFPRSYKTLKIKYESIKRTLRKKMALIRAESIKTGGGPSIAPPLNGYEERLKFLILLSCEGTPSTFDNDTPVTEPQLPEELILHEEQLPEEQQNYVTEREVMLPFPIDTILEVEEIDLSTSKTNSSKILKTPCSRVLKRPKKGNNAIQSMAETPQQAADLQVKLIEQEMEDRALAKRLKEDETDFRLQEREHEKRMWALKEREMELKIKILEKELNKN